jgi:hypothetical protein
MLENSERRFYTESDINLPNYTWTEYPVELKGNGMTTTDRNTAGRFQIIGNTVFWHVDVNFNDVAFNNTAVMYITVPFPAAVHTDSASGALHDVSSGKTYPLRAHYEQYDRVVQLFHPNNQGEDTPVAYNFPVTISTNDYFHVCGWYEAVFND